jgi:hypothetical protein
MARKSVDSMAEAPFVKSTRIVIAPVNREQGFYGNLVMPAVIPVEISLS